MIAQTEQNLAVLYNDNLLADLMDALDRLHTAASEGQLQAATSLSRRELAAWLNEVVYTAQETLRELGGTPARREPKLLVLEKPQAEPLHA